MGKLRVFFTIALVVLLLPLSAFGRHKKGDIVQDPNHSNITRECVSDEVEESDRWLVHITGTLPVSGMHCAVGGYDKRPIVEARSGQVEAGRGASDASEQAQHYAPVGRRASAGVA